MPDADVKEFFRRWRSSADCPWYITQQYLEENGRRARGGAGPAGKGAGATGAAVALAPETYEARIAELVAARDYAGAAALQQQQQLATECDDGQSQRGSAAEADAAEEGSQTEHGSDSEDDTTQEAARDLRVLKMLYKGNMEEISRQEEQSRKAKVYNRKHNFYRNARCTNAAQEEQSALPGGVINVNEDSDDDEAYMGEQKEIAKELEELRAARHWINQDTYMNVGIGCAGGGGGGGEGIDKVDFSLGSCVRARSLDIEWKAAAKAPSTPLGPPPLPSPFIFVSPLWKEADRGLDDISQLRVRLPMRDQVWVWYILITFLVPIEVKQSHARPCDTKWSHAYYARCRWARICRGGGY